MAKRRQKNIQPVWFGAGAVALAVAVFLVLNSDRLPHEREDAPAEEAPEENEVGETEWVTYTNETFDFSIDHPHDWTVREFPDEEPGSPKFNIFPESTDTAGLPFTHHSESVTHVSVYPEGIPTEGFFGEATASNVEFAVPVERARDYVLADGARFATFAGLPDGGENWTPAGFIFAHVRVAGVETACLRGDEEIAAEICDPLTGDTLVRRGAVDAELRETEVRMLESFRFTE